MTQLNGIGHYVNNNFHLLKKTEELLLFLLQFQAFYL